MASYTDSEPVSVDLDLLGVWIHDPEVGGEDTAVHYPYGDAQRELSIDAMGEANYFAGRTAPVVDYGEHEARQWRVTVDVPHGADWTDKLETLRSFAVSKRTLFFRDNRGRALYGQMTDFREADQDWGTQVAFGVLVSHWELETVA